MRKKQSVDRFSAYQWSSVDVKAVGYIMTCLNSDTSPLLFARSCVKYQLVSTCHGLWKCFRGWEKKVKSMRSPCHSNRRYGNGAMAFAFVRMTGQVTAPAPFYCTCRAGPGLVTRLFSSLGLCGLCLCSFNSMSATVEHAEPNRYCDGLCQNFSACSTYRIV